ncbi:tripartite motif-containing protein 16-like [Sphaeramia orbicularis]|uniref:tripartite motif-containing protein 16-like n=1 Tax=Sphaeramia orbicularis TaxID=375764 RepID=UPI00117EAC39|nr:tripartite motif-containing protein 16-like [Sphaeramia orbicularis]
MAEGFSELRLCCSICLDVLKNPVTLQCGHSYCMDCINGYWDQEGQKGVYCCPQCRFRFRTRPTLSKSTVLADLVGTFSVVQEEDGVRSQDVECDFCTEKKLKAVKSCLVCLASFCATHLEPHYVSAAFRRHQLVEVSASIQEKICSRHDKLLEVYCRTDDQCICLLCVMDEHKGHDTVSAAAERKEKQKQFDKKKHRYQQGIQEKEKQLKQLKKTITGLRCSGDAAVNQNEKVYSEIVSMADKRRCALKELIRVQENAAVSRAQALVHQLENEISGMRKKENEIKQLSLSEDHIRFLQTCHSILNSPESNMSTDVNIQLHAAFDFVTTAISDLKGKLESMVRALEDIAETIEIDPDPTTRQEFSIYSCHLSLDPNTAFENLMLSEGNSKVTWVKKPRGYPYHPDRFTKYDQVLCAESLFGVCYWEVHWKGPRVEVAVCYKGAEMEECGFGYTDKSWCFSLSTSGCTFWHNGAKTKISVPCSSTVGVYLNHQGGNLSFYSVSDSGQMTLLHKVQTTFSEPLTPGFMVSRGSSIEIISSK